jgi:hypothetical protein
MGRALIRGMLNSARGISDKDTSAQAQAARRISGFRDLDGLEFLARVDVGEDAGGDPKNEIRKAITPDHRGYARFMGGGVAAAPAASAPAAAPAAASAQPKSGIRPPQGRASATYASMGWS